MLDTEDVVDSGAANETETPQAPLEDITSSTEVKADIQEEVVDKVTPPTTDPLKVLESLELDPATKEALKAGYLRQADYTKKTQELAKDRGTLEEYSKVKPVIEFLGKNPELFNEVVKKMQGNNQPEDGQERIPEDPKEYAEWVKANTIKEVMAMQAQEAEFQQAAQVDPRLNSDSEFGEVIARMVASDQEYRSGQINSIEATKKAVATFDKYISKAINLEKQKLSEKAKAKKAGSTVSSTPGNVKTGNRAMTIEEAVKLAEEELSA